MKNVLTALRSVGSDRHEIYARAKQARNEGWSDVPEYVRRGIESGLNYAGLFHCEFCGKIVDDPAHDWYQGETTAVGDRWACSDCAREEE